MCDFLQQMLNDEEHNRKLNDARNRADIEKRRELFRWLTGEELIPAMPELQELAEFLAKGKTRRAYRDFQSELRDALTENEKPSRSNCLWCDTPLLGLATALCEFCEEARQQEKKDCYEPHAGELD